MSLDQRIFLRGWQIKTWRKVLLMVSAIVLVVATATAEDEAALRGFTPNSSKTERAVERIFLAVPNPERARAVHKKLTTEPHMAGSIADRRTAEYVAQQFRSYGLDTEIDTNIAVLSEPGEVKFDLMAPVKYSGPTPEYVAEDSVSRNRHNPIAFNAFSGSGEVSARVVYANHGRPADYEFLRSKGVSTDGKIVIVRYGESYRGVKARMAERNKAAGLLIYSDPQDDGYHLGDSYPAGPWRPASGIQRGSVLYEFISPGMVAVDGSNVPHLPIIPLSYTDAAQILKHLKGAAAPPDWQGGLPFTYHIGLGPATVHMKVRMNQVARPIWNVIAKIRGTQDPEEIVLVGNHRDAWAYGGVDPNSGTTSLLEMARGFGTLLRQGWRPRRSIWLLSWDGEEMGEFGSVAWAQKHSAELDRAAVAYLNVDYSVAGDQFVASAVPSLKRFLSEAAGDVPDPAGGSVLERATERVRANLRNELLSGHAVGGVSEGGPIEQQQFEAGELGGGTDFIAFFNHFGIPSADMEFDGPYGVYHSIFDDHRWMEQFGDPKFAYHITFARLLGLMGLRLAAADVLPLDYETYGQAIETYIENIHKKMVLLGEGTRIDFEPAAKAAGELVETAGRLRDCVEGELREGAQQPQNWYALNRRLVKTEHAFLLPNGLPGRPWYRHAIYAPGIDSGYDPVALPAIEETVDAMDFDGAQHQLEALTVALQNAGHLLEDARLSDAAEARDCK